MGEVTTLPAVEDDGNAEDGDITDVIDPETTPGEEPKEEAVETPEETPEATPEEPAEEEPVSADLGMEIMSDDDPAPAEQTITVKIMKGTGEDAKEDSTAAEVEFVEDSVTKDKDKVTVKPVTPIKFTVTLADEIVAANPLVTAKAGTNEIANDKINNVVNEGVYTITIANGENEAALMGNVEITIHVTDKTYEVSAPESEDEMGISWKIKERTAEKYATDASKVSVKKSESVTVQATINKEKTDPVEVTLNKVTRELKATADADGTVEFTIAAADLINDDGAVKTLLPDYVVKSKVPYVLTAPDKTGVKVIIKDAKGTQVNAKGTTGADANTYELINKDTYSIEVTEGENAIALSKLDSVKVNNAEISYNGVKKAFVFTANASDPAKTIVVALKAAEAHTITVQMDSADAEAVATIATDAYKTANTGDATDNVAAADAIEIANKTYDVWEGTPFSFTLAAKNKDYYKIDKVEISTDNERTWSVLTGTEAGKYTIDKVEAAATIKVYTKLDAEKAYSITFKDANGNVDKVEADLKGAASYAEKDADKAIIFMPGTEKKVTFKVTPHAGYTVDKVASGTADADVIKAENDVYTYTFETNTTATITISTKATGLNDDKYVKFVNADENVTLSVSNNTIEPVKDADGNSTGVYKLTKAEGNVSEICELPFTLTVPYGSCLADQTFADGTIVRATTDKRVKSEDGKTWTYSYKVVANQVGTTTLDSPYEITISDEATETVTLKLTAGSESVQYKLLDPDGKTSYSVLTTDGTTVDYNKTVILQAAKGQSLKINGEAVELDDAYRYRFDAKLSEEADENETEYKIEVKSAAEYKLQYKVGEESYSLAGEEPVEVEYGDMVALKLTNAGDTAVAISKTEVTENAKSVVTPEDQSEDSTKGQATVKVQDGNVTVTLYTIEKTTDGKIAVETEVEAAKITFTSKDASGKVLTVKGITKGKSVKLDATSVTSYALTLKEGRTTLNAAEYDKALKVVYGDAGTATSSTKVEAVIEEGSLIVKPLLAEEETVKILAAADNSELFSFKVNGQTPALKVKSVTSVNQGMNDILVDVAADAGIKTISDKFALYYEVKVASGAEVKTNQIEGTYYLDAASDEKGKIAPKSQLFKVNSETDNAKMENTYTFTVRLVAVTKSQNVVKGNPVNGTVGTEIAAADVKFATAAANIKPVSFKTRKGYYEDKLGVTKKTTKFYSGQQNVLVAIPKFSKNASHIEEIEAVVYKKDGSLVTSDYGYGYEITARVDEETLGVYVDAGAYAAGTYDVVIYATATKADGYYNMYRASAKVPITVQKSINAIDVDCPSQIAVLGRDASVTLKTTGYFSEYGYTKAQTQKFLYELDPSSITNAKNKDQVIVKGNKVTVKKGFKVSADPSDNAFTVDVYANDYSDNIVSTSVDITVTNEALVIGSVKLVGSDGKELGDTLTTEQIKGAKVVLTDDKGKNISPDLVTLTPNKGKIYVAPADYTYEYSHIVVSGYQKNLTVKAVTKDGGKKSASSKKYTITYPEGISYAIKGYDYSDDGFVDLTVLSSGAVLHKSGNTYSYIGRGNDTIDFCVTATTGSNERQADASLFNYGVKVTGGKITSSKNYQARGDYSITPNKDTVKITITDKTKKTANTTEFTFKDNGWQARQTAAAPKAATKGKLYYAFDANTSDQISQSLTYTVTAKNANYGAVKLTPITYYCTVDNYGREYELRITNNTFTLNNCTPSAVGTAKYSAVYGDYDEDDIFIPKTKAATLSIKVNKAANPKAVAKYTINPKVSMSVPLQVKPDVAGYENRVKFIRVLSADNKKGDKNQFYDYFEVDDNNLQIKAAKWANLKELEDKTNLTGYLEYQYYDASTGNLVKKQDKITVVINDKTAPKYTATNVDIVAVANATAATTIKLGGTSVSIAKVKTNTEGWEAAVAGTTGVVNLTAKGTPASGNVDLYVIPTGSQNYNVETADPVAVGIKVTVKVTVKAADDNKSKITIAKGAKTPAADIVKAADAPAKVTLTVELEAGKDFTYNLSNATIATAEKTKATLTGDNKTAADAVESVTLNTAKDTITIVLNRDGLVGNKQYKVPVDLTFTAGAAETVYFPVKTEKIPTITDIKKLVENKLKNYAVVTGSYNDAAKAAADVKTAAADTSILVIPALSGIEVTTVVAADADKFADKGETKGDHKIKITLEDLTKAADAADRKIDAEITVTEKVVEKTKTVGDALKEAIGKYAIPNDKGEVPEGKIKVTTALETDGTLQTALQKAVDSVDPNKYFVNVSNIKVETTPAAAASEKAVSADEPAAVVTNLSFSYKVLKATTGEPMDDAAGKNSYAVDVKAKKIETPLTTPAEPDDPNPGTTEKVVVTIEISPATASVKKGESKTFTATLKDSSDTIITDDKKGEIQWTVTGKNSNETKLEPSTDKATAILTVDAGETGTSLTVTAKVGSAEGTATVTVTENEVQ